MSEWDRNYNEASMTEDQLYHIRLQEDAERREESRRNRGYIDIPPILPPDVIANFARFADIGQQQEYGGVLGGWSANRIVWICHRCGSFGYKYTLRETFTCYHCHHRDVTVCRSGELSLLIRGIRATRPGVNMLDIFAERQRRQLIARAIRREQRELVE